MAADDALLLRRIKLGAVRTIEDVGLHGESVLAQVELSAVTRSREKLISSIWTNKVVKGCNRRCLHSWLRRWLCSWWWLRCGCSIAICIRIRVQVDILWAIGVTQSHAVVGIAVKHITIKTELQFCSMVFEAVKVGS